MHTLALESSEWVKGYGGVGSKHDERELATNWSSLTCTLEQLQTIR